MKAFLNGNRNAILKETSAFLQKRAEVVVTDKYITDILPVGLSGQNSPQCKHATMIELGSVVGMALKMQVNYAKLSVWCRNV